MTNVETEREQCLNLNRNVRVACGESFHEVVVMRRCVLVCKRSRRRVSAGGGDTLARLLVCGREHERARHHESRGAFHLERRQVHSKIFPKAEERHCTQYVYQNPALSRARSRTHRLPALCDDDLCPTGVYRETPSKTRRITQKRA